MQRQSICVGGFIGNRIDSITGRVAIAVAADPPCNASAAAAATASRFTTNGPESVLNVIAGFVLPQWLNRTCAEASVAWPQRFTSTVGVNHRRENVCKWRHGSCLERKAGSFINRDQRSLRLQGELGWPQIRGTHRSRPSQPAGQRTLASHLMHSSSIAAPVHRDRRLHRLHEFTQLRHSTSTRCCSTMRPCTVHKQVVP